MTVNYRKPTPRLPLGGVPHSVFEALKQCVFQSGTVLGVAALNAGYQELLAESDELVFFDNKTLRLCLLDLKVNLDFHYHAGRISRVERSIPNITFSGNSVDFVNLARQKEDPDTLFFQRRLTAEGDMALAVELKNCLAGVDQSKWPAAASHFLALLADVLEALAYARSRRSADTVTKK